MKNKRPHMSNSDTEQVQVPVGLLFAGLENAYDRLLSAIGYDEAFQAVFEILHWLVSLDDRYGRHTGDGVHWLDAATKGRRPDGPASGTVALKALMYARNSVHHRWADAVYWTEGAEFPIRLQPGQGFGEWRWRPNIPPPRNPKGRDEYDRTMAGRSVRLSIEHVAAGLGVNAHLVGCDMPSWIVASDQHPGERQ